MSDDNTEKSYTVSTSVDNLESENITLVQDGLDKNQKWTHVGVMCLLEILWEQYEKANISMIPRKIIFENAAREMRKNGFNCTKEDVQKKYGNMTASYRRIKANMGTARNGEKLTWPYFEIMKEIRKKELNCRIPIDVKILSPSLKRKGDGDPHSSIGQNSSEGTCPPLKREKTIFSNNLSTPSGGVAVGSTVDCSAFSNQWEEKRFALEDFKMQLIETLFKDVKQQRSEAEEDALTHLQMRHTRNRHLKEIVSEMSQLRTDVRRELSSLSESINDLISALRNNAS